MLSPAYAKEAIGIIGAVEEEVFLSPANSPKDAEAVPAEIGQQVYLNDTIVTGANARAVVLFADETEITLGENANLVVDEFVYAPDTPTASKGRFNIMRGAFLFASGMIGSKEKPDVVVNTMYGSIGIRGTQFWGGSLESSNYSVFVLDGEIIYQTKRGRVKLTSGEGTSAYNARAIPSRPKIWSDRKIEAATATIALRDADAVSARINSFKEHFRARGDTRQENLQDRKNEQKQELEREQEDRKEKKTERNTRYVPASRQQVKPPKETQKKIKEPEMPAPPALPVEPVKEKELIEKKRIKETPDAEPAPAEAATEKEAGAVQAVPESTAPVKTQPAQTKEPVEVQNPRMPPAIPREGNEAPDFEKWEQQHLETTPRAPPGL